MGDSFQDYMLLQPKIGQIGYLIFVHAGQESAHPKEAPNMMNRSLFAIAGILLLVSLSSAKSSADTAKDQKDRLQNAGQVMQEILNIPDDIPQDLLDKARCVVVMPSVLKAAFIVGGSYGRGTMVCRTGKDFTGPWGAPAMYALEGGSVGFQIGGEATDFVFLVINNRGVSSLLHSKVKLGADASAAAGPKGRTASADTDAYLRAEILTYSRARGAFAGVSLEGSTLRPDDDGNRNLYGKSADAAMIITENKVRAPAEAHTLTRTLQKATPHLKP
jgi:lipid-binding SYLF domain-containing protein